MNGRSWSMDGFNQMIMSQISKYIKSIRRRRDYVTLEVGRGYDIEAPYTNLKGAKVKELYFNNEYLMVKFDAMNHGITVKSITSIVECKPVLFITVDGKDIRQGDEFHYIHKNLTYPIYSTTADETCGKLDMFLRFSTVELVEEYIFNHQIKYSLSMIREALLYCRGNTPAYADQIIEEIKEGLSKIKK